MSELNVHQDVQATSPGDVHLTIPIIKKEVVCPKPIQKLIFQMNYRGFYTGKITWGEPIEIEMESFDYFMKNIKLWRKSNKESIREMYKYLVHNIEFKTQLADPYVSGNRSDKDLLKVWLLLPQSEITKFTQLFYNAHIKKLIQIICRPHL